MPLMTTSTSYDSRTRRDNPWNSLLQGQAVATDLLFWLVARDWDTASVLCPRYEVLGMASALLRWSNHSPLRPGTTRPAPTTPATLPPVAPAPRQHPPGRDHALASLALRRQRPPQLSEIPRTPLPLFARQQAFRPPRPDRAVRRRLFEPPFALRSLSRARTPASFRPRWQAPRD